MDQSQTPFCQQVDLSDIKKAKFSSDRDLEAEIAKACDILRDTCNKYFLSHDLETHDWKKRTESLKRVQEIPLLYQDILNG